MHAAHDIYILIIITLCLIHFKETRISAPTITAAERVSNDLAIVTFDPQDEVTADLFIVDYYVATDLETSNLVINYPFQKHNCVNCHCRTIRINVCVLLCAV